jgi:hypothetical protein
VVYLTFKFSNVRIDTSGVTASTTTNNVQYHIHLPNFDAALIEALKNMPNDQALGDMELFNKIISAFPQQVRLVFG